MNYEPLTRQEVIDVIEGRGHARRVPMMYHAWIYPNAFDDEKRPKVEALLEKYPMDAQVAIVCQPEVYKAPEDDPSFRWSFRDPVRTGGGLDNAGFIEDYGEDLEPFLADFPNPEYHGLTEDNPPEDGRYRLGKCFFFYFERFWKLRGMENALTDFYLYPDEVHAVFRKLTDYYKRVFTKAKNDLKLDGILVTDDLGTQKSAFFSTEIFDEFFAPYYKEVIAHTHALGMHFWLHTCGNVESLISRYIEAGIDILHPIQKYTMDERKIAAEFGSQLAIWAGFDVQQTIPYGTPEEVRREVRYLIDSYRRSDGRFLLTLGNGTTPDTPVESLEALFDETLRYGQF